MPFSVSKLREREVFLLKSYFIGRIAHRYQQANDKHVLQHVFCRENSKFWHKLTATRSFLPVPHNVRMSRPGKVLKNGGSQRGAAWRLWYLDKESSLKRHFVPEVGLFRAKQAPTRFQLWIFDLDLYFGGPDGVPWGQRDPLTKVAPYKPAT